MNENKLFLDTNILIYAYDISAGKKNEIARKLVVDLWETQSGCLSTQVLQEFFVCVTKKIPKPLDINRAKEIVHDLLNWNIVVNDGGTIIKAINIHLDYKFSFWDSLIIQSAINGGAETLYTEDFVGAEKIKGVEITNPFV